jgi:hypothetical protein
VYDGWDGFGRRGNLWALLSTPVAGVLMSSIGNHDRKKVPKGREKREAPVMKARKPLALHHFK